MTYPPMPWTVRKRDDGWYEIDHAANGGLDCRLSQEVAERIVACVNALKGIPTNSLALAAEGKVIVVLGNSHELREALRNAPDVEITAP